MQNLEVTVSRSWRPARQKVVLAIIAAVVVALAGAAMSPSQASGSAPAEAETTSVATKASPASTAPRARRWPPTPSSVGVPKGAVLRTYNGPCTITKARKVLYKKTINCSPLIIKTVGVVIKKSKINGSVLVGTQDDLNPTVISDPEGDDAIRVTIIASEIETPADSDFRPIGSSHYVVKRSYLHGTYSGGECHNACTIKKSYVHGFGDHASGLRILRNGTLKHNTIWCEPNPNSDEDGNGVPDEDGGCSGDLTMYEEFGTPHNNLVKHNYFPAGLFWYTIKFNGEDAGRIRIVNNLFGLPKSGVRVADDWDAKPSNVWSGNTFPNGRVARP